MSMNAPPGAAFAPRMRGAPPGPDAPLQMAPPTSLSPALASTDTGAAGGPKQVPPPKMPPRIAPPPGKMPGRMNAPNAAGMLRNYGRPTNPQGYA